MRLLIFAALLFLISCQNHPKNDVKPGNPGISELDKEQLRYLKKIEWPKAYREHDTLLLDRILGDEFQMIDANGNWSDKDFEMNWIKNNASDPDSFYYDIKRFDFLENGTAILCGTGHIFNDTTETIYQSSNIFLKRDGIWKAVSSQVSGVKKVD